MRTGAIKAVMAAFTRAVRQYEEEEAIRYSLYRVEMGEEYKRRVYGEAPYH